MARRCRSATLGIDPATSPSRCTTCSATRATSGTARATTCELDPHALPAHVFRVRRRVRTRAGLRLLPMNDPVTATHPQRDAPSARRRRSALVQGRGHLRAARPRLPRQRRRRHRRLPRPDREARLPAGPRRHRALAPAVLPLAAARRRLRHRRLHRRPPDLRHAATTSRRSCARRTGAACASSPSWSSTTPPTSTPGSSARAAPPPGSRRARLLRLERHARAVRGGAHHLQGLRALELDLGPGRQGVLLAPLLLATSRTSTSTTRAVREAMLAVARLLARAWASTACASTPSRTSSSARAPTARTCPRRTTS